MGREQEGDRFSIGDGQYLTVNPTDDPGVPGGWYQSTTDENTGEKSTAVYDSSGQMPSGFGNNDDYR